MRLTRPLPPSYRANHEKFLYYQQQLRELQKPKKQTTNVGQPSALSIKAEIQTKTDSPATPPQNAITIQQNPRPKTICPSKQVEYTNQKSPLDQDSVPTAACLTHTETSSIKTEPKNPAASTSAEKNPRNQRLKKLHLSHILSSKESRHIRKQRDYFAFSSHLSHFSNFSHLFGWHLQAQLVGVSQISNFKSLLSLAHYLSLTANRCLNFGLPPPYSQLRT